MLHLSVLSVSKNICKSGQIERVVCGGENYDGSRPCNFDWVKSLRQECVSHNVTFCFIETGTYFIKDGKKISYTEKIYTKRNGV